MPNDRRAGAEVRFDDKPHKGPRLVLTRIMNWSPRQSSDEVDELNNARVREVECHVPAGFGVSIRLNCSLLAGLPMKTTSFWRILLAAVYAPPKKTVSHEWRYCYHCGTNSFSRVQTK